MAIIKLKTEQGNYEIESPMLAQELLKNVQVQLTDSEVAFLFVENSAFHKGTILYAAVEPQDDELIEHEMLTGKEEKGCYMG